MENPWYAPCVGHGTDGLTIEIFFTWRLRQMPGTSLQETNVAMENNRVKWDGIVLSCMIYLFSWAMASIVKFPGDPEASDKKLLSQATIWASPTRIYIYIYIYLSIYLHTYIYIYIYYIYMVSVICQALFRTPNATTLATWNPILVTPLLFSVIPRGSLQVRPTAGSCGRACHS